MGSVPSSHNHRRHNDDDSDGDESDVIYYGVKAVVTLVWVGVALSTLEASELLFL
ncbi:hypothetical protein DPMN_049838 [Dreissena polymorpha]|uniref:Uncharacterized protein n=1 Tax=Dreissena polymorpha TaxID=45954 RepID=A0A9D4CG36_DREPO|nr:hypothetical protein DPMN_049838 [Dreissena polymorpha]